MDNSIEFNLEYDINKYKMLLENVIKFLYDERINIEEKGIFEWKRDNTNSNIFRTIKKIHFFEIKKNEEQIENVDYGVFKNSIYISKLTELNTFDIYTSGGGMTKRYTFELKNSKIKKIKERVITII
ncbi:MAG: hypothetical protein RIQ59_209 [Bacteroidota bacterium]|jgi:hypothetical protein